MTTPALPALVLMDPIASAVGEGAVCVSYVHEHLARTSREGLGQEPV